MVNLIKRPLIWVLGAYLAGLLLAWYGISFPITLFFIIIGCLCIYLFMFRIHNGFINRKDLFLWSLPFLLMLGCLAMGERIRPPEPDNAFDEETYAALTGKISMVVKRQKGTALYVSDNVITLSGNKEYLVENILVNCSDSQNYYIGNKIYVSGKIRKFSSASNPGQFNEWMYYKIQNIDYKVMADKIIVIDSGYSGFHYLLDKIKQRLLDTYQAILPQKEAGTLIAMLLGEKYLLDDEIRQLYQENGISHILAISGLHVSLIGISIYSLLRKLKAGLIPSTAISIISIFCYGVLTNFSVSTNRAVVMFIVMLLAKIFGKTYDMLSGAALSALIILLQNPLQIMSAGFLLSFGAVLGIAILFPCMQKLFPSKNAVINSLYISLSAQAATTPFVIWFFYQFPTYGLLTNLIILPFISVLTLTSIIAGIAGAICKPIGIFLIGGANYILKFYELVCRIIISLPGNLITVGKPGSIKLIIYIVLLGAFVWTARKYEKKYAVLLLALPLLIFFVPESNPGLEITFLDVGQGDAIYMESRSGTTYFVDGGSMDVNRVGNYRIQPFLLSEGTDSLDYAVMTHSDNDHISGLTEIIQSGRIHIKHLILPDIENKDEAYLTLEALALEKKIVIQYVKTGDYIIDGDMQLRCLHPQYGYKAASSNAYSITLSVSYGNFDMLLTGDLQQDGEKLICDLLENKDSWEKYFGKQSNIKPVTDYDVLKVAHHGARSSTTEEFLKLIKPEYSLISCGKDNYYGHPHRELLDRLNKIGSEILITYETGAITIRTDGKRMKTAGYRSQQSGIVH